MTDRRRNLFVLLLVAGLLVASLAVIATKPTRLGLDLKGGVSLIYQAKPTKQSAVTGDAIDRSLDVMRKRVDQIGVAEPSLQRSGADQIDVSLPDVKNADEAAAQVGTAAQMWFYDWEGSVLGPNCKPDPANTTVTGGPSAGISVRARAVAVRRGHAGREVSAYQHRQGVLGRQALPRRQEDQARPRRPRREPRRPRARRAGQEAPLQRRPDRHGAAGRHPGPRRAGRPEGQAVEPLVRPEGPDGARRHGHQEPRAELRQRGGESGAAERPLRLHRPRREHVWSKFTKQALPARPGVLARRPGRRLQPALRDRAGQRAHLGRRRSRGRSTRTGSRPAAARRSPAASPSRPLSSWPTC